MQNFNCFAQIFSLLKQIFINFFQASKEAQQYLIGNEELVIVATSRKKKLEVDMNRIIIPHLEPEDILVSVPGISFYKNFRETSLNMFKEQS